MHHYITVDLGDAPDGGKKSIEQCLRFKRLLRQEIGREPDDVWLETTSDHSRRGLMVRYDPESAAAENWAKRARDFAEHIWTEVAAGKDARTCVQIQARTRGA